MYEKADKYIFEIFCKENSGIERNNDFRLFVPQKQFQIIGGNIFDENGQIEYAYFIKKDREKLGIKIGDGKYIYSQRKRKFVDCPEFESIICDDRFIDEDDFKRTFRDLEYVEIFESDKELGNSMSLSYLVNGNMYLLMQYCAMYDNDNNDTFGAVLNNNALNSQVFKYCSLDEVFEEEEKINLKKFLDINSLLISDKHQLLFYIYSQNEEMKNLQLRINLIKKIYNEVLQSDKKYDYFVNDIDTCFESLASNLRKRFGDDCLSL